MFYRMLRTGRFGNYPAAWSSLEDVLAGGFTGEVSIRSREISNPVRIYHIPVADLAATVAALPEEQKRAGLEFSEAPPDDKRVVQGERDGQRLYYSYVGKPMRFALAEGGQHLYWAQARMFLKRHLTAGDYEWLESLLEDFPGHTVEFSAFSVPVGQLGPTTGSQCIFWELRGKY
jgi:hypothetical protein